ncbi:hypothetical protein [Brevibacterium sandarakinum]|uniref:hypothetical protein n=1 Tax=Brevibacterium sandarakinum TaxID=629680 RepID=UPI00264AFB99|nr:hypothetical protein [Brevibacterium sandarakinum]MDN5657996.1 hypothetical protein [Brevibacterium sandarakinum]
MFHHLMNRFAGFVIGLSIDAPDRRGERRGDRPDRGDVPGWVLITLMTAGLVVALWALAGEAFTSMFQDAMNKVRGAG